VARHRRQLADRFWPRVDKSGECWVWTGARDPLGYGRIGLGGRSDGVSLTHRVAWLLTYGAVSDGMCVLHACDNPSCVRPDHLFLGTRDDNNKDMTRKGRHGRNTLTDEQVRDIRRRRAAGEPIIALAREFGTSHSNVSAIAAGRSHALVPA